MEVTKEQVLRRLPGFKGVLEVSTIDQDTPDIIAAIMASHESDKQAYDRICDLFDAGSAEEIGQKCFYFLKSQTRYVAEDEDLQTVRSPAAIVQTGQTKGIDCKNYSLFTAGVLDGLNRNDGAGIDWCFRFAAYSRGGAPNTYLRHVFIVLYPGTKEEIWIDPVLSSFNSREKVPCYFKDKKPMLGRLSGIPLSGIPLSGIPGRGRRGRMGDDSPDDYYMDPQVEYYDPSTSTDYGTNDSQPFDLSSSRSAGLATQQAPDLSPSQDFNPQTAVATSPDVLSYGIDQGAGGNYLFDWGDLSGSNTYYGSGANFLDSIIKSFTGSSGSSGGGSGGGGSAGGGSQQKAQTPQTGAYAPTPTAAKSSNTIIIVAVLAAVGLGVYFLNKK